jgi:hypothetical protein
MAARVAGPGPTLAVAVTPLTPGLELGYATFVAGRPDALISYTLGYRDLLVDVLGCEPRYAVALRGEAVVGVMPLMSLDGPLGQVLNSLPYFGSNGGPLADDPAARDALGAWYAREAQREGVVAATVVANPLAALSAASLDPDLLDLRIAHVTPLAAGDDPKAAILAGIDGSARRNVAKAHRRGTTVAVENQGFAELEALHRSSMAAIGAQVKDPAFFRAVPRHFRPGAEYDLYIARIDGAPTAALLVFYCAVTVDYYVPAVSPDHRSDQPMAAILLEAMTAAAARGLERWNWGGSWPSHESLQRFKAKWGGIPRDYRYETKLNDEALLRATPQQLLAAYPGFFVVPFSHLAGA